VVHVSLTDVFYYASIRGGVQQGSHGGGPTLVMQLVLWLAGDVLGGEMRDCGALPALVVVELKLLGPLLFGGSVSPWDF